MVTFSIEPRRLCIFLLVCMGLLVAAYAGAQFAQHVLGFSYLFGLIALFDLNGEQNLPTLFSSVLLLACSLALALSGRLAERMRGGWYALTGVFALMAISETAALHEPLLFVLKGNASPTTAQLAAHLPARLADWWPALALIGTLIGVLAVRFLLHLDARARRQFVLAGLLYAGGAVGLDEFTAAGAHGHSLSWWAALMTTTFEEILEMTGAVLLLYSVLDRLARLHPGIGFRLRAGRTGESRSADPQR